MSETTADLLEAWVAEPRNTARSVLVTIFGDTILPTSNSIWLAQLFQLTDIFGFSGRLVRTSMFRLAAEGWFTSERLGRQSRYSLTPLAIEESEQAAKRIYHPSEANWSDNWTVVFLDTPAVTSAESERLAEHLKWHGFVTLSGLVLGSPTSSPDRARDICELVKPEVRLPFASLEFADIDSVVAEGFLDQAVVLDTLKKSYEEFVEFYQHVSAASVKVNSSEAFALRTMLVHDLRRIRLRGPDLPATILPADWIGDAAFSIAGELYEQLSESASSALSEILDTTYPATFSDRFVNKPA